MNNLELGMETIGAAGKHLNGSIMHFVTIMSCGRLLAHYNSKQVGAELCQTQYRLVHLGLHRFPTKLLLLLTRNNNVGKQVLINSCKFSTFV